MPGFFEKSKLPPEMLARWSEAEARYDRVMEELCRGRHDLRPLFYNANREKSALFWRLLQGKEPLPHPPPCRWGYPWYEVIEEAGTHRPNNLRFFFDAETWELKADIDGCRWQVEVIDSERRILLVRFGRWPTFSLRMESPESGKKTWLFERSWNLSDVLLA